MRLRSNQELYAFRPERVAAELCAKLECRADSGMRETTCGIGLERQTIDFVCGAQICNGALGIELAVQIHAAQTVFTGQRLLHAVETAACHQRCEYGVRGGETGLY